MLSQESCWIEQYIWIRLRSRWIVRVIWYWNYQSLPISGKMHLPDLVLSLLCLSPCPRKDLPLAVSIRPERDVLLLCSWFDGKRSQVHSLFPLRSFSILLSSVRIRSPPDWRPLPPPPKKKEDPIEPFSREVFGTIYVTCERQSMIAFSQPHNQFSDLAGLKIYIYISMIISSVDLNRRAFFYVVLDVPERSFEDNISKRRYADRLFLWSIESH